MAVDNSLDSFIDNTLLQSDCTKSDIQAFVKDSMQYSFAGLCVPPFYVPLVKEMVGEKSNVKVVTVIGFPLGYQRRSIKLSEAKQAIDDGADELDLVMNISAFKSAEFKNVKEEVTEIAAICHQNDKLLKLIIEVALLSDDEIKQACELGTRAHVDFIKTSTGFANKKKELSQDFIRTLRSYIPERMRIKASGGIKDAAHATALIQAGAARIGTSSGISIMKNKG